MLLRNFSSACRRLSHQHVSAFAGRSLREPVYSFDSALERWRNTVCADAGYKISVREQGRVTGIGFTGARANDLRPDSSLGATGSSADVEWQTGQRSSRTGHLRPHPQYLEGRRSCSNRVPDAVATGTGRRESPQRSRAGTGAARADGSGRIAPTFDRQSLLRAKPVGNANGDWAANSSDGSKVTMRPFMSIDAESYSTYVRLKS